MTTDARPATCLLQLWGSDRGLPGIGRAVGKPTSEGAELFGPPRTRLAGPGPYADVKVIDLDRPNLDTPETTADLPLGADQFVQQARGYKYPLIHGPVGHDEPTEARPGRLVTPR